MKAALDAIGATFALFASPATYSREDDAGEVVSTAVAASARGLRADELAGAADQFDRYVIVPHGDLARAGLAPPRRFDRVKIGAAGFRVFDHRPSPAAGDAVFYKLMCKGGAE